MAPARITAFSGHYLSSIDPELFADRPHPSVSDEVADFEKSLMELEVAIREKRRPTGPAPDYLRQAILLGDDLENLEAAAGLH